jgi:hypothetical protein
MEPNTLSSINQSLQGFLENLSSVNSELPVGPDQVAELLSAVLQVGEWLPTASAEERQFLESQVAEYRRNLERLRGVLPLLELRLQSERARLESQRAHLQAAVEWATASKQSL